jgi:hypothetical protein
MGGSIFPAGADKGPEHQNGPPSSQADPEGPVESPSELADPGAPAEPERRPADADAPAGPQDGRATASFTEPEPATQDNAQYWAPIIVDKPIIDFEPKPPTSSRLYLPDTIFDGWSTDHFTVRLASVRGYSHRYDGLPRQDAAEVVFHQESGAILFAVADGVSGASESHLGATMACLTAVQMMKRQLSTASRAIDLLQVVQAAAERLTASAAEQLGQNQPTPAAVIGLFATTLVTGYVRSSPEGADLTMVQVGDSSAWVLHHNRYSPILGRKDDPHSPVVSSEVSPLPRIPEHLTPAEFRLAPDKVLLVGTDGFGDPLGDGEGRVGHLFARHLRTPPPARGLAHLLDFSRDTFDDDRTLVVVWQKANRPEVPP